jgi:transcriptional regulator with XRE-family HTH domain
MICKRVNSIYNALRYKDAMHSPTESFSEFLQKELQTRVARNQRYSLRTFSKSLDLSAGYVSQLIGNKRKPSVEVLEKVASKLKISHQCTARMIFSLIQDQVSNPEIKDELIQLLTQNQENAPTPTQHPAPPETNG